MKIVLDYGHGGSDPGATYKSRKESNDVLKLGQAVAKILKSAGVTVVETRSSDKTVSLQERTNISNNAKPDWFISIHRNAFKPEQASGAEVFVFTTSNIKEKAFAASLQQALVSIGYRNRGVKLGNYHVLRETKAQSILLEVGFIDTSNDNKIFDERFNDIAAALATTILKARGIKLVKRVCTACGQPV